MNPDPEKPWTNFYDVVEDLVRPPLDETRELVQKSLDDSDKQLRALKAAQQHLTDLLANVPQDQRLLAEQLTGLRNELQGVAGAVTGVRHEQRQLGAELAGRLERVDLVRSAVDAEYLMTRQVYDAVADLHRRHAEAVERMATLESVLTDPRVAANRSRPIWLLSIVSGTTLALVIADLVARLL